MVNRSLNDYEHLQREHELLKMEADAGETIIRLYDSEISVLDSALRLQDEKIKIIIKDCDNKIKVTESKLSQYKIKSRRKTIGVGVGGTLLGIILGVLLSR